MRLFIPFLFSNTPRCHVFVVFMYGFAPPMYWAASSLLFVSLTDWMSLGVSTQHPSLTRFWCVHSRTQCAPFFGFRSHFGLFTYLIQRTWRYSLSLFRTPLISTLDMIRVNISCQCTCPCMNKIKSSNMYRRSHFALHRLFHKQSRIFLCWVLFVFWIRPTSRQILAEVLSVEIRLTINIMLIYQCHH